MYIPLNEAIARLGPALIGDGWIARLTRREQWLVDQHHGNMIIPGGARYVSVGITFPHDELTEVGRALNRAETMNSQWEQARDWLTDFDLIELRNGDEMVSVSRFDSALVGDGLAPNIKSASKEETGQDDSDSAVARAVKACIQELGAPGHSVTWERFNTAVRDAADGWVDRRNNEKKRGFSDRSIRRHVERADESR